MSLQSDYPRVLLLRIGSDRKPWGLMEAGTYIRIPKIGHWQTKEQAQKFLSACGYVQASTEPGLWTLRVANQYPAPIGPHAKPAISLSGEALSALIKSD